MASSARRALTLSEFEQIMACHWRNPNKLLGMCCAAALAVQLSMIARRDDVAKFREFDLGPYELFHCLSHCLVKECHRGERRPSSIALRVNGYKVLRLGESCHVDGELPLH